MHLFDHNFILQTIHAGLELMQTNITFGWVCWLIFVDCRLDVAEGGRRRTLLQDADCVAKLIRKLETKHIHVTLNVFSYRS